MSPKKRFQKGEVFVSLFENEVTRDGETSTYHSVSCGRRYRDQNGEWATSSSLTLRELPIMIRLLQLALDEMLCLEGGEPSDDLRERLMAGKKAARPSKRGSVPPLATLVPAEVSESAVPHRMPPSLNGGQA